MTAPPPDPTSIAVKNVELPAPLLLGEQNLTITAFNNGWTEPKPNPYNIPAMINIVKFVAKARTKKEIIKRIYPGNITMGTP